jgi:hypothetical protein
MSDIMQGSSGESPESGSEIEKNSIKLVREDLQAAHV